MFSTDDLSWIDFEVYGGPLDLKAAGTFRYVAAVSTRALVLGYAIGDAPALTWHADGAILDWDRSRKRLTLSRRRRQAERRQEADPTVLHRRREPARIPGGMGALSRLRASRHRGDA